jgi:hypothetical protein
MNLKISGYPTPIGLNFGTQLQTKSRNTFSIGLGTNRNFVIAAHYILYQAACFSIALLLYRNTQTWPQQRQTKFKSCRSPLLPTLPFSVIYFSPTNRITIVDFSHQNCRIFTPDAMAAMDDGVTNGCAYNASGHVPGASLAQQDALIRQGDGYADLFSYKGMAANVAVAKIMAFVGQGQVIGGQQRRGYRLGLVELKATCLAPLSQQSGGEDQQLVFSARGPFHSALLNISFHLYRYITTWIATAFGLAMTKLHGLPRAVPSQ